MGLRDTVLMVTNRHDEHASHVVRTLNERQVPVFRLNTEDFSQEILLVWHDDTWELRYHGRMLLPSDVRSCWYRRPSDAEVHPEVMDIGAQQFVRDECNYVLQAMYRCLDGIIWVSHPDALQASKYKAQQLHFARQLGFNVPKTLFTNDPAAFLAFHRAHGGRVIVKIAGRGPTTLPVDQAIYTTLLEGRDVEAIAETVRYAPHLFQQYVEKAYEVRVTVIGDHVFAVRIDSQANEQTRVDWRHYDFARTPHTPIDLPADMDTKCRTMVARYGLSFGAMDFVVTPSGDWVFLEINPNGQWLWLEELTGLPMTAALVDVLTK